MSLAFDKVLSFCPRCGMGGFLLKPEGCLFCSHCGLKFFFNTASAVAALITDSGGRLLMTIRASDPGKGMLDLPGGFVNHDESAEEALKREIIEELGVEIVNLRYFGSWPNSYIYSGLEYKTLDLAFKAKLLPGSSPIPQDDVAGIVFLSPSEINYDEIAFSSIRKIVLSFMETVFSAE